MSRTTVERLPTFLIVGAARSATTTLWDHLRAHPDVFMPEVKEPSFFVEQYGWRYGLDWYLSLFDGSEESVARGEASVLYTQAHNHPGVPERIARLVPEIRLVYLVRHPVERLLSQYRYEARLKRVRPIDEVLLDPGFLSISMYAFQLERFLRHFERDQILWLTTDELGRDPIATVQRTLRFVGVPSAWVPSNPGQVLNRGEELAGSVPAEFAPPPGQASAMPSAATLLEVVARLQSDVERLPSLLGHPFDDWGSLDSPLAWAPPD